MAKTTESNYRAPTASAKVRMSSTLDGGVEVVDRIPIGTSRDQEPVVAMSIGGSDDPDCSVPDLRGGDRLEVFAEIEVTVDLTPAELAANARSGGKATGEPYDFAPAVTAQLLLASSPTATSAGSPHQSRPRAASTRSSSSTAFESVGGGKYEYRRRLRRCAAPKGLPWTGR